MNLITIAFIWFLSPMFTYFLLLFPELGIEASLYNLNDGGFSPKFYVSLIFPVPFTNTDCWIESSAWVSM